MKSIPAAQFKQQCLSILDHVDADGIVITKHGKPVATLHPIQSSSADLIGSMNGKLKINDDVRSTGLDWDAQS